MENKYYTPDLSEFYFGFEYEQSSDISEDLFTVEKFWKKFTMSSDYTMLMIYHIYKNNAQEEFFRVKYLDEEDIISLGFQFNSFWYTKNILLPNGVFSVILKHKNNKLEIVGINGVADFVYFDGTIKNKSELRKLLIQLGIHNEN